MRTPEFPKEITKGSCTVTIYHHENKGYDLYTLAYYQGGKRKREQSSDYGALRTRADEVLDDLNEGRTDDPGRMKHGDRLDWAKANEIMRPTGVSVLVGVTHFAKGVEILGSDLVVLACQEYAKRHAKITPTKVSDAVTRFLADMKQRKEAKLRKRTSNPAEIAEAIKHDRYLQSLTSHLTRFKDSVLMNIASVTAADIDLFIASMKSKNGDEKKPEPVSARTKANHLASIVSLFEWAKGKRLVPADFDEHTRATHIDDEEDGPIEIYTPEEMKNLLDAADAKLRPFLAIGAFAGLRSSEIMRLDWADVRTENGSPCIVVQKGKDKRRGKSRRIVPMADNLKAWLLKHEDRKGKVWPFSVPYLYEMLREVAPKAKTAWKQNALRHSCISYRVASIKNVPQVALESGNSPEMIDHNYRELVTEEAAKVWFSIAPEIAPAAA